MANQALQIKRGLRANLPQKAALGEPLIATDTREMYIGAGLGDSDGSVYKIGDIIFADTPPPIAEGKVWIDTVNDTIHRVAAGVWQAIGGAAGSGSVTADITVYGVTQGGYSDGNVIPAGTSLEDVVKNMLQTIIPPTYASPTLSLVGTGSGNSEAGTTITPTLTPTFLQKDGGAITLYTLNQLGTPVYSGAAAAPYTDAQFIIGDNTVSYQATAAYDQGPIKNDNQGNPTPAGQIAAGVALSNTVSYVGKRRLFYAFDTGVAAPAASADVRSLGHSLLAPVAGTTLTLNIPAGTTRVVIAYPATIRDLTSVKYVELGNGEVKDTFALSNVNVEGADGYAAVAYKVYTYVPAVPFGDAVTYNVTI